VVFHVICLSCWRVNPRLKLIRFLSDPNLQWQLTAKYFSTLAHHFATITTGSAPFCHRQRSSSTYEGGFNVERKVSEGQKGWILPDVFRLDHLEQLGRTEDYQFSFCTFWFYDFDKTQLGNLPTHMGFYPSNMRTFPNLWMGWDVWKIAGEELEKPSSHQPASSWDISQRATEVLMGTSSNYMRGFVKSSRWYDGKRPTHLPLEYRKICKKKYHNITYQIYHNHQTNIHLTSCVAKQLACLFGSLLRILKASVLEASHWSNQSVYLATASLEESCVVVRHFCPGNIKMGLGRNMRSSKSMQLPDAQYCQKLESLNHGFCFSETWDLDPFSYLQLQLHLTCWIGW